MRTTVGQRSCYTIINEADTSSKCDDCGRKTCLRDHSSVQVRLAGYTISATIPSKRCSVCGDIRVGARDLDPIELIAVSEILKRGIRTPEVLASSRDVLGLQNIDLATVLRMKREDLFVVLDGNADLTSDQWKTVINYVEKRLRKVTEFRQPTQIRVTKPRHKQ
ncbi:MAG: hypothetical protein WC551_05295 [Patescibacteria group bacterium]